MKDSHSEHPVAAVHIPNGVIAPTRLLRDDEGLKLRPRKAIVAVAVGYCRVSTSEQDMSIATQAAALEEWTSREGVPLLVIFYDRRVSGGVDVGDRPGLCAAFAALSELGASVLVAAKLDRFARDAYIIGSIDRIAHRAGARVVTADGATKDELRRDLDVLISAHERRLIRQRTKDTLAVMRAGGRAVGRVPFGFALAHDGRHSKRCKGSPCSGCRNLVQNTSEQAVIARAKTLSDHGLSLRRIAAQLATDGCVGRTGNPLSATQVHRFLRPLLLNDD
jgi:DNA invertase Pin-like site-specific DNA recombinase